MSDWGGYHWGGRLKGVRGFRRGLRRGVAVGTRLRRHLGGNYIRGGGYWKRGQVVASGIRIEKKENDSV
jgi:hypothetical protein